MERFNYTQEETDFIQNFNGSDSKYWESQDQCMATIKAKVRSYYLPLQKYECCYCKMLKQEKNGKAWNIEHIFPRESYPQFMFTPINLAISCIECNNFKLAQDIKINKNQIRKYPKTGSNIKIIHPHLDDYDSHIKVNRAPDGSIFHTPINKSKKGRNTIIMCNLFRFQEAAFGPENLYLSSVVNQLTKTLTACVSQNMTAEQMEIAVKVAVTSTMGN